jgi:hypothetical protein
LSHFFFCSFYVRETLEGWGIECSDWVGRGDGREGGGGGVCGGGPSHGPDVESVLDLLLDVRKEVCVCVCVYVCVCMCMCECVCVCVCVSVYPSRSK